MATWQPRNVDVAGASPAFEISTPLRAVRPGAVHERQLKLGYPNSKKLELSAETPVKELRRMTLRVSFPGPLRAFRSQTERCELSARLRCGGTFPRT